VDLPPSLRPSAEVSRSEGTGFTRIRTIDCIVVCSVARRVTMLAIMESERADLVQTTTTTTT